MYFCRKLETKVTTTNVWLVIMSLKLAEVGQGGPRYHITIALRQKRHKSL